MNSFGFNSSDLIDPGSWLFLPIYFSDQIMLRVKKRMEKIALVNVDKRQQKSSISFPFVTFICYVVSMIWILWSSLDSKLQNWKKNVVGALLLTSLCKMCSFQDVNTSQCLCRLRNLIVCQLFHQTTKPHNFCINFPILNMTWFQLMVPVPDQKPPNFKVVIGW